jgi:hypothetical protein
VTDPEAYCRDIEAYLCRKNDGHLIRIVGPAFEQVSGWAREGIPLKVALAGVDRYFERYYRKGPRRRPVRIEFCEADVRDAFDDWRRAVGVARVAAGPSSGGEESAGRRSSLAAHVERAIARVTMLRASSGPPKLADALEQTARQLDAMQAPAARARGDKRAALLVELDALDRALLAAAIETLTDDERARVDREAGLELAPFRDRMAAETFAKSREAAFERLVRERYNLPDLRYG